MAVRRMFFIDLLDSDEFMDMPLTAQALYFHLAIRADDDGFVNNPKSILRMLNADTSDYDILLSKNFIIAFDSGVIVIRHWNVHNSIPKDRYKPTEYSKEYSMLTEENKVYTLCKQNVSKVDTQDRLDKDSIVKVSKDKDSLDQNSIDQAGAEKIRGAGEKENPLLDDDMFSSMFESN